MPVLVIRPSRVFPPVEFCRGTKPSQAAKCRAVLSKLISTTVAAISDAVIGPMPGIVARRLLVASWADPPRLAVFLGLGLDKVALQAG